WPSAQHCGVCSGGMGPGLFPPPAPLDSNSNFVGEVCDSNENWSQPAPGSPPEEGSSRSENTTNPSDNLLLGAARPHLPEPGVRSPPEGAEVGGAGDQNAAAEKAARGCGKPPSSPAEDNGYASSSLSIDSPDSTCGNAWDTPTSPGTLFPALAEAVQHLQDKERFKEQEKEKHHIQLVMYRRLALLRWIHSLQQKVVDQQNRLQESFDTILDNRKELIRCMQQGPACPTAAAAPSP
uniref:Chromosome 1 open reading frame 216 n=1 Tax=Falco tinnunculus TaxID=100819 RepID=A0A8C4UJL6_FALTI